MVLDMTTIKLLIPIILIQIGLMIVALLDLRKRKEVVGDNKLLWGIIIILFQIFGPLVYFVFGRKEV